MGRRFFESEEDYRARIGQEADERTIEESTGSAPSKGFFESVHDYRARIGLEADERTIEGSTASAPSKGLFEDVEHYRGRVNREANERTIEESTGSVPRRGVFETGREYRRRIDLGAKEHKARGKARADGTTASSESGYEGGPTAATATPSERKSSKAWLWIIMLILAWAAWNGYLPSSSSNSKPSETSKIQFPFNPSDVSWDPHSPLLLHYGHDLWRTFDMYPDLLKELQRLRPGFNLADVGTTEPSLIVNLHDGRVLLIMGGCRPHACNVYRATIGMDTQSGEFYLYEGGENEHFSGRNDATVAGLLQYVTVPGNWNFR